MARRARVFGRVQGVYFRASAAARAAELDVAGQARNLPDGSVEVLAVGAAAAVESLLSWLSHGPPLARVDRVEVEELPLAAAPRESGFRTC